MPNAAVRQSVPALPIRLPRERDVYRVTGVVPGMVTYFAVTGMGKLLNDEMLSVLPGAVSEACAVADLEDALNAHDGHISARPPLKLHRPSASASPSL